MPKPSKGEKSGDGRPPSKDGSKERRASKDKPQRSNDTPRKEQRSDDTGPKKEQRSDEGKPLKSCEPARNPSKEGRRGSRETADPPKPEQQAEKSQMSQMSQMDNKPTPRRVYKDEKSSAENSKLQEAPPDGEKEHGEKSDHADVVVTPFGVVRIPSSADKKPQASDAKEEKADADAPVSVQAKPDSSTVEKKRVMKDLDDMSEIHSEDEIGFSPACIQDDLSDDLLPKKPSGERKKSPNASVERGEKKKLSREKLDDEEKQSPALAEKPRRGSREKEQKPRRKSEEVKKPEKRGSKEKDQKDTPQKMSSTSTSKAERKDAKKSSESKSSREKRERMEEETDRGEEDWIEFMEGREKTKEKKDQYPRMVPPAQLKMSSGEKEERKKEKEQYVKVDLTTPTTMSLVDDNEFQDNIVSKMPPRDKPDGKKVRGSDRKKNQYDFINNNKIINFVRTKTEKVGARSPEVAGTPTTKSVMKKPRQSRSGDGDQSGSKLVQSMKTMKRKVQSQKGGMFNWNKKKSREELRDVPKKLRQTQTGEREQRKTRTGEQRGGGGGGGERKTAGGSGRDIDISDKRVLRTEVRSLQKLLDKFERKHFKK